MRRRFLQNAIRLALLPALLAASGRGWSAPPRLSAVTPGRALTFPRDFGSHPDFRTEWWYVTGWLETNGDKRTQDDRQATQATPAKDGAAGQPLGFQITFFRSATDHDAANPSRFAPKQLIIAHAALSDPAHGRLLHDQRSARAGFGIAEASEQDTDVKLDDWRLVRGADGRYRASIRAREFSCELVLAPTQPILLQGEAGYSRKGPRPELASHYYSKPHLTTTGTVTRNGKATAVAGSAWLDHEWSNKVLDANATGWDWIGINLDDGGALMAFRIRAADGRQLWADATLRRADGTVRKFAPEQVRFTPQRLWRSPRTGATYPVALRVDTGELSWLLDPLQDDQELDSRLSTGAVYWEGAVTVLREGRRVGRGYLEMTGYVQPIKL